MYESTQMIGEMQFLFAMKLMRDADTPLNGPVAFRHSFVNMANLTVHLKNGTAVQTCPAALGYSFAAGTTDGPGQFDFTQHTNTVCFCLTRVTYLPSLHN
jgi:neutral ceramidase